MHGEHHRHSAAVTNRLEHLSVFPDLAKADAAWLQILENSMDIEVPGGTVLLCRTDRCDGFLLPWHGSIRVQQTSEDGREAVLYRVEPGDICILALTSLVDDVLYGAEAVTETAVKGVVIPIEQFKFGLDHSGVFRHYIFTVMARRLRDLCAILEKVMFHRLDNRMACLLYTLFNKAPGESIQVTHQELAQELGSTREVVSRVLKDLERNAGCIALHRGRIELLSLEKLGLLARNGIG